MAVTPEKKQRLSVYLDSDLKRRLADFAERRGQSSSLVAEAAIASFVSPDADERKEASIVKRLDWINRNLQRQERDLEIASETLALFVRFWLNSTVPLPEGVQAEAREKGAARYDQFIAALGRRLSRGSKLRHEVSEELEQNN